MLGVTKNSTEEVVVKFTTEDVQDSYERKIIVNKVVSDKAPITFTNANHKNTS